MAFPLGSAGLAKQSGNIGLAKHSGNMGA